MNHSADTLKILLVQARDTADMEAQEQRCFVDRCRLPLSSFVPVNVVRDPLPLPLLRSVDAVMIGGAGEYSAYKNYPWMSGVLDFVRAAANQTYPVFGTCWGHQVIARALGGEVRPDPQRAEFGCGAIQLTPAGKKDPLFSSFPELFQANMGHQDRVTQLPPDAIELAFNEGQRNQAFRIADLPIYGTQFHSELDAQTMQERLLSYRGHYDNELGGEDRFREILESLRPTTEVDHLMFDFLRMFVRRSG